MLFEFRCSSYLANGAVVGSSRWQDKTRHLLVLSLKPPVFYSTFPKFFLGCDSRGKGVTVNCKYHHSNGYSLRSNHCVTLINPFSSPMSLPLQNTTGKPPHPSCANLLYRSKHIGEATQIPHRTLRKRRSAAFLGAFHLFPRQTEQLAFSVKDAFQTDFTGHSMVSTASLAAIRELTVVSNIDLPDAISNEDSDYRWLIDKVASMPPADLVRDPAHYASADGSKEWVTLRHLILEHREALPSSVIVNLFRLYSKARCRDFELFVKLLKGRIKRINRRSLKDNLFVLEALSNLEIENCAIIESFADVLSAKIQRLMKKISSSSISPSLEEKLENTDFVGFILNLGCLSCTRLNRRTYHGQSIRQIVPAVNTLIHSLKDLYLVAFNYLSLYHTSAMAFSFSQLNAMTIQDFVALHNYWNSLEVTQIDNLSIFKLFFKCVKQYLDHTRSMDTTYEGDMTDEIQIVAFTNYDNDSKILVNFVKCLMRICSHFLLENTKVHDIPVFIDLFASFSFILLYFPKLMEQDKFCVDFFGQLSDIAFSLGPKLNAQFIARLFSIFSQRKSMNLVQRLIIHTKLQFALIKMGLSKALKPIGFRSSISKLIPLVPPNLKQFEMRHISMIYNACATVNIREEHLMNAFESCFKENKSYVWSAQSVANILRSVAKLDFYSDSLLNSMIKHFIPYKIQEFTLHGLINISFALAVFDKAYDAASINNLWNLLMFQIIKKNEKASLEGLFQLKLITYLLFGPNTNGVQRICAQPLIRCPSDMDESVFKFLLRIWDLPMKLIPPQPSSFQNELLNQFGRNKKPILSEIVVGPYIIDILAL